MTKIKTYPDISAKCIKEGLDFPYRLWLLFRQNHPVGWLTLEDAYRESLWNKRQTKKWLVQGEGFFWTRYGDRLYLRGIVKVCKQLNAAPFKPPVFLPVDEIKNLKMYRAFLFASWFAGKSVTISQKKLSEIFGRSPRTLYVWARLSGLEIRRNLAWSVLPTDETIEQYPQGTLKALGVKESSEERGKVNNVWVETWEEKKVLCFMIPNTYRAVLETGVRSRFQRRARQAVEYAARATVRVFVERGPNQARTALRLLRKNGTVFIEEKETHHDHGLWNYVAV